MVGSLKFGSWFLSRPREWFNRGGEGGRFPCELNSSVNVASFFFFALSFYWTRKTKREKRSPSFWDPNWGGPVRLWLGWFWNQTVRAFVVNHSFFLEFVYILWFLSVRRVRLANKKHELYLKCNCIWYAMRNLTISSTGVTTPSGHLFYF